MALYGTKTWTLRKVDQKCLGRFEMWCWRNMEISRTGRVRNLEELQSQGGGGYPEYNKKKGG